MRIPGFWHQNVTCCFNATVVSHEYSPHIPILTQKYNSYWCTVIFPADQEIMHENSTFLQQELRLITEISSIEHVSWKIQKSALLLVVCSAGYYSFEASSSRAAHRPLADVPHSWIRNGRIANLEEGVMFCNFFGRPCSGEPRSSAFWMSLPRRVKGTPIWMWRGTGAG